MRMIQTGAALVAGLSLSFAAGAAFAAEPPAGWLVLKGKTSTDHVIVGGELWNCKATSCTTKTIKSASAVDSCKTLAAKLGPIARFSAKGAELAEADLAACNAAAKS